MSKLINQGLCERYDDRAKLTHEGGKMGISLFHAQPRSLPYKLTLLERHPLGSQAFLPLSADPFLVIVARDDNGVPATPLAFLTQAHMGINFHANIWHGVLTPLAPPGLFAVVDRIGEEGNLEEYHLPTPYIIDH